MASRDTIPASSSKSPCPSNRAGSARTAACTTRTRNFQRAGHVAPPRSYPSKKAPSHKKAGCAPAARSTTTTTASKAAEFATRRDPPPAMQQQRIPKATQQLQLQRTLKTTPLHPRQEHFQAHHRLLPPPRLLSHPPHQLQPPMLPHTHTKSFSTPLTRFRALPSTSSWGP